MNNVLAAKVLMSHLPKITDGEYKTATEIAIKALFSEAKMGYYVLRPKSKSSLREYLELTDEQYERWVR